MKLTLTIFTSLLICACSSINKDLDKKIIKFDPNDACALLLKDYVPASKEIYSSNIIYLEDYL